MLLELIVVSALAGVIMKRNKKKRLRRFLKPFVARSGARLLTVFLLVGPIVEVL